jgi:hypothetical protein
VRVTVTTDTGTEKVYPSAALTRRGAGLLRFDADDLVVIDDNNGQEIDRFRRGTWTRAEVTP